MKNEIRYSAAKELRVQVASDGTRTITGTIPYNSRSCDIGGFVEIIAPGAFAGALAPGADVLCLRDHDAKLLMGRSTSSTLVLVDSPAGLTFRCVLPKTQSAMELAESIDRGDLTGVSFGFTTNADVWTADEQGNVLRTLVSVNLAEISPCSFPAYTASSVSIRSCPVELRAKLKLTRRTNADGCDCDCPECLDDDCENCSMDDCDDPNCADNGCPNQDGSEDRSVEDLGRYMRLQLALRSK
jgi:uncharacterized protein